MARQHNYFFSFFRFCTDTTGSEAGAARQSGAIVAGPGLTLWGLLGAHSRAGSCARSSLLQAGGHHICRFHSCQHLELETTSGAFGSLWLQPEKPLKAHFPPQKELRFLPARIPPLWGFQTSYPCSLAPEQVGIRVSCTRNTSCPFLLLLSQGSIHPSPCRLPGDSPVTSLPFSAAPQLPWSQGSRAVSAASEGRRCYG